MIALGRQALKECDTVLIAAGAGMGIDSGLPDFRGKEGLWRAYPYFREAGMSFSDAANPEFLRRDPKKFWFFYGHRYQSYVSAVPHHGFTLLRAFAQAK